MYDNSNFRFVLTPNSVSLYFDGQLRVVNDAEQLTKIRDLIREKKYDDVVKMVDHTKQVRELYRGKFDVRENVVFVDNKPLPQVLSDRLIEFANDGLDCAPLLAFWDRLKKNPSRNSQQELFTLLERNHHPILEDGRFVAWKCVAPNYFDKHSGKFDNHPGCTPEVERFEVDDDFRNECSYGLHAASWEYASKSFFSPGDHVMEVFIDPADVVSVPHDYNFQKMRVCKYFVNKEVTEECKDNVYGGGTAYVPVEQDEDYYDEDEEEEWDEDEEVDDDDDYYFDDEELND